MFMYKRIVYVCVSILSKSKHIGLSMQLASHFLPKLLRRVFSEFLPCFCAIKLVMSNLFDAYCSGCFMFRLYTEN